jgi:alcohol dehydrogenase
MDTMKAVVFRGINDLRIEEVPKPRPTAGQAVIRITATTICGTDVHIVRGEYPVRPGLILGHEPVGVIEELGEGLEEYAVGQRVIVGAITPCGQCFYCLNGAHSQCHGPLGGWRFGNTINGAWAEYLLVPDARANLAVIPEGLTDEAVLMLPDIASTGISGAESGNIRIGDAVAVFAHDRLVRDARRAAAGCELDRRGRSRPRASRDGTTVRRVGDPRSDVMRRRGRDQAADRQARCRRGHRSAWSSADF